MASGRPNRDLGRILHDPLHVWPECEAPEIGKGCRALRRYGTKAQVLRVARAHAAKTGHTVTLHIEHWQRVHPQEA